MKLSVIILNYNVCYFLKQCILSVKEAIVTIDAEIIVVDNNSQDGSCEMVLENFPDVILLQNKENSGFSKANNQGVAIAKGEYVCILNPDTAVTNETFTKTLNFAELNTNFGAIGARLIDGSGNYLPESKRNIPTPKVSMYKMLGLKSVKHSYYANHIKEEDSGEVAVLVGAFMLIKKSRYEEVGGFDEDYFMYGEDIDLSYKLIKKGYTNYYVGQTTVLHYKGESTVKDKTYIKRFYGAMLIFYKKHFSTKIFFQYIVFLGVAAAQILNFFRLTSTSTKANTPETYYLLSDNIQFLKQITSASGKAFKSVSKSSVNDGGIYNSQLVFDANYISYYHIFRSMQFLKNKNNTFRIRPIHCNFIVGSDSSNAKGEVIQM